MKNTPHPFSLRQLQYAVAVADTGGFRRAAEACGVSQPALSAQLAQLEDALGATLFERGKRGVLETRAGAVLLANARRILREASDLDAVAQRLGDPLSTTLRIGIIPTLSPYLVPDLAAHLGARFPALEPHWVEERTDRLRALLVAGDLDAAIVALESDLGDVDHFALGRDPFLLAVPKGHALAGDESPDPAPIGLDDLHDAALLLLEDGHCLRDQTLRFCGRFTNLNVGLRATSLSTLAQMVAGGVGITLLPKTAIALENRHGRLAIRAFAEPAPYRTVALAWRRQSPMSASFRKLAVEMRRSLSSLLAPLPRTGPGSEST